MLAVQLQLVVIRKALVLILKNGIFSKRISKIRKKNNEN